MFPNYFRRAYPHMPRHWQLLAYWWQLILMAGHFFPPVLVIPFIPGFLIGYPFGLPSVVVMHIATWCFLIKVSQIEGKYTPDAMRRKAYEEDKIKNPQDYVPKYEPSTKVGPVTNQQMADAWKTMR